jgi:hypothetical protein
MKLTMLAAALPAVAAVAIHPAQVSTQSRSISQTTRDHLNAAMTVAFIVLASDV